MIILVAVFVALLVLGMPVAFSMALATIAGFIALGIPLETVAQKMMSGIEPFPFVAIPLFVLAGALMETSGISRRLVALASAIVGHIRGGLGIVVVASEVLFSGISGSSVADASAIGSILIPSLVKAGYPPERAAAIVAAASGMGILIPPCLVMVILGAMSGLSISALFVAGFLPGILMALTLALVIHIQARRGILPGARGRFSWATLRHALREAILPLGMPVVLFGGILGGVTTATEAAVLAVIYALVLDLVIYREITRKDLGRMLVQTGITTAAVSVLAGFATGMSWTFATTGVPQMIAGTLQQITTSPFLLLALVTHHPDHLREPARRAAGADHLLPDPVGDGGQVRHRPAALRPARRRRARHRPGSPAGRIAARRGGADRARQPERGDAADAALHRDPGRDAALDRLCALGRAGAAPASAIAPGGFFRA